MAPVIKEAGICATTIDRGQGKLTVGVDLSDRTAQCCVLGSGGEVIDEFSLPTTERAFRRWFSGKDPARVILEAGTHSHWTSRLLAELGHEVIVANPRMLRFIYGSDSKNDRADAAYLARVGRLDPGLLHPIVHRSEETQGHRTVLRSRHALVQCRSSLINHARGTVKSFGSRLPRCTSENFAAKVDAHVPDILRPALGPVLDTITALTEQIQELDRRIDALAKDTYPETALLAQVPGVGRLTALAYVLTVEDPSRFAESRVVGSYLGRQPRQRDSGVSRPQLSITRSGDEFLRYLLVECACRSWLDRSNRS